LENNAGCGIYRLWGFRRQGRKLDGCRRKVQISAKLNEARFPGK